ncbi:MAG TPA: hypothetical protein V6D29_01365 [Leptolyngbyaceae cyanobacterium]
MNANVALTYTELKSRLAEALGRVEVKPSTLSRWMKDLEYPKGQPGVKRQYDLEDLIALASYGQSFQLGMTKQKSIDYALSQVEKFRHGSQY